MRFLKALAVSAVAALVALPSSAQTSLADGFQKLELQSAGRHAVKRVRFPDKSRGERFELRAGDCPRDTGDCGTLRERVEFWEKRPQQKVPSEIWMSWEVFLPAEFNRPAQRNPAIVTLGQFHQTGTSGPEMMFSVRHGGYEIKLSDPFRLDDDPMNPIPDYRNARIAPWSEILGRWTKVVVNARWSRGTDGYIRIWVNGQQRWSYSGATTNANEPIYFKYGLYRSSVDRCGGPCPTLVAYYRNVKRGTSREHVE